MAQTAVQDGVDLIGEVPSYIQYLPWWCGLIAEINISHAFCCVLAA